MVKRNPFLSGACAILGGICLLAGSAKADVTSDSAAGIVVFPKLVLDSSRGIDTEIQLTNTSTQAVSARCFYVNANSHCSNNPEDVCLVNEDCGSNALCLPGWIEIDFNITLTPLQPTIWTLAYGRLERVLEDGTIQNAIPAVPEDPFRGELKCIQVGDDEAPVDRNDLKGEATIVTASATALDARGYNALGIQAVAGAEGHGDNTLVLGEEYNGCPNILILDHFFDDAVVPFGAGPTPRSDIVRTDLTLVPCSENFVLQDSALFNTTVQFLVFNEFEQRFSTSTSIRCFRELTLSDIDTRPRGLTDYDPTTTGDPRSIFNVNVQGTLTGQTRIRGVDDGSEAHGNGLLGVAEEFHRTDNPLNSATRSASFNLHQVGERATTDIIAIP